MYVGDQKASCQPTNVPSELELPKCDPLKGNPGRGRNRLFHTELSREALYKQKHTFRIVISWFENHFSHGYLCFVPLSSVPDIAKGLFQTKV